MYFEVKQCRPRLEKLKYLLNENLYKGPENEPDPDDQAEGNRTKSLVCKLNFLFSSLEVSTF